MAALMLFMMFVSILQFVFATVFILACAYRVSASKKKRICVIVLGDIGRSPRMQYHANSFVKEEFTVDFVGFSGSKPLATLSDNPNVSFHYLFQTPVKPAFIPSLLFYVFKSVFMALQLLFVLVFLVERPKLFLVQNPPSIPTLCIAWIVSRLKGSQYVVDWHNYGFSILSLNLNNKNHPLVKFAFIFERMFGYFADQSLCVTKAMQSDLFSKWNVKAEVLYDRPPERFKRTTTEEKHELFLNLQLEYSLFKGGKPDSTVFTSLDDDLGITLNENRPATLISSTSWTEDEDFSILLNALKIYQNKKNRDSNLPSLICIITGKGPQKEFYLEKIKELDLKNIQFVTPWVSSEDYPRIIGSGDVGVCLHLSSSGLDLPMKVVDMFGCGLPVCAVNFSCLDELVQHNINGLVFDDSDQLACQLVDLLHGFPDDCLNLEKFRENLTAFQRKRWHTNWKDVMSKIIYD